MLVELTKMEQRYDAVMAVIRDGFAVAEVAEKFGASRQSVHTWMSRYEDGGVEALADRSHRPRSYERCGPQPLMAWMTLRSGSEGPGQPQT